MDKGKRMENGADQINVSLLKNLLKIYKLPKTGQKKTIIHKNRSKFTVTNSCPNSHFT